MDDNETRPFSFPLTEDPHAPPVPPGEVRTITEVWRGPTVLIDRVEAIGECDPASFQVLGFFIGTHSQLWVGEDSGENLQPTLTELCAALPCKPDPLRAGCAFAFSVRNVSDRPAKIDVRFHGRVPAPKQEAEEPDSNLPDDFINEAGDTVLSFLDEAYEMGATNMREKAAKLAATVDRLLAERIRKLEI